MSKEILKIQTCTLKVNIHCDGCKRQVKKILQKIEGVYTVCIDSEQGKVTISGNVDPSMFIKKLAKSGKHAHILGAPKQNHQINDLFKNTHVENGGKIDNDGKRKLYEFQQLKEFHDPKLAPKLADMKLPPVGGGGKDGHKLVTFNVPESDDDDDEKDDVEDVDDEYDDDDEEYELIDDDDDDDDMGDISMKKPVMVGGGRGNDVGDVGGGGNDGHKLVKFNEPESDDNDEKDDDEDDDDEYDDDDDHVDDKEYELIDDDDDDDDMDDISMKKPVLMGGGRGNDVVGGGIGLKGHMGAVKGSESMTEQYNNKGAMMNQQEGTGNESLQPMMYDRLPTAVNYTQPPYPPYSYGYLQAPQGELLTHYPSDENNTTSCNVM